MIVSENPYRKELAHPINGLPWAMASIARDIKPRPETIPAVKECIAPIERYIPPNAQNTPHSASAMNLVNRTLIPAERAASSFSPTARIFTPSLVPYSIRAVSATKIQLKYVTKF